MDDYDSNNSYDDGPAKQSGKKTSNKRKRAQTVTAKKRSKKQSKNNSKDGANNSATVTDLTTPDKRKRNQGVDVGTGYLSDGDEILYGPCGDPTFGQDAPPTRLHKLIGEYVALEFEVDGHEDLVLYTGVVRTYNQTTDKFTVRILLILTSISCL